MTERLSAHDFELVLDPAAGGEVVSLEWKGEPLLRPAPPEPHDVRESAAFPLVPFASRIQNGVFSFDGQTHRLPPNLPPERHALHGHGWQSHWHLLERSDDAITLLLRHPHGAWKWAYRATQRFQLTPQSLIVELAVTNLSASPMPAGLGWHPYFHREDARLSCPVTGIWPGGTDLTPDWHVVSDEQDLSQEKRMADLVLDHAFIAAGGPARIFWPSRQLEIEISPSPEMTHWVVYCPEGERFFCVEPISHAPNAVNMDVLPPGAEMHVLAPGETFRAGCTLTPRKRLS